MSPDDKPDPESEEGLEILRSRVRRRATLKTSFLTGLVVAAPIGITVFIVWTFVDFVDNKVRPIILKMTPAAWHDALDTYAAIPGLGLLLVVVALTLLGMLTANIVGRTIVGWGDFLVHRVPIIGTIYKTLKQIFETVVTQTEPAFKQVCLIEYPRKNCWCLAFVIGPTKGEIALKVEDDLISVFLPKAPSPASGYLMFLPKDEVRLLDMTVEEGIKMVVSVGIVTPDYFPDSGLAMPPPGRGGNRFFERLTKRLQAAS